MATKQLITRIALKHDIEKNWITAGDKGFCPLAGEIIIYDAEEGVCSYNRYKVGRTDANGELVNINDLPFERVGNGVGQEFNTDGGEIFNDYIYNEATGMFSHAEGRDAKANGLCAHAEGDNTQANGDCSHTEGKDTIADNTGSHAEGDNTAAYGKASHAEGAGDVSVLDCLEDVYDTDLDEIKEKWNEDHFALAYGYASHTEGNGNIASGYAAHAEGEYTDASGHFSHTEGQGTVALSEAQHVQGKYNIKDENNKFAHIVGNGEGENKRSNAHTLDWNGNAWFAGDIKIGGENQDDPNSKFVATVEDLKDNIENALFIFDKNTRTFKYSGFTLDSFKEQIVAEVIAQLSK